MSVYSPRNFTGVSMFITSAFAQDAATQTQGFGSLVESLPFFAAIFAILYFLMIRPQQRRVKEHRALIANLRRGDVVITAGGLIGKIDKLVDESEAVLELGEGVKVRVLRSLISEVRSKSEPIKAANDEKPSGDGKAKKSA